MCIAILYCINCATSCCEFMPSIFPILVLLWIGFDVYFVLHIDFHMLNVDVFTASAKLRPLLYSEVIGPRATFGPRKQNCTFKMNWSVHLSHRREDDSCPALDLSPWIPTALLHSRSEAKWCHVTWSYTRFASGNLNDNVWFVQHSKADWRRIREWFSKVVRLIHALHCSMHVLRIYTLQHIYIYMIGKHMSFDVRDMLVISHGVRIRPILLSYFRIIHDIVFWSWTIQLRLLLYIEAIRPHATFGSRKQAHPRTRQIGRCQQVWNGWWCIRKGIRPRAFDCRAQNECKWARERRRESLRVAHSDVSQPRSQRPKVAPDH